MSKRVISIRLSDQQILLLDKACARFRTNRSETITAAIGLLDRYYSEGGRLTERYEFDLEPLMSVRDDKN